MSDETRTTSPLSDRDLSLLSTYIDGELSAAQGASLQRRLQQEPALQAELDALQRTVSLLQSLPAVSPPRNFTLNVAEYGHIVPVRRSRWLTFGTPLVAAGASLLLVAVCVGVLLLRGGLPLGRSGVAGSLAADDSVAQSDAPAGAAGFAAPESEAAVAEQEIGEELIEEAPPAADEQAEEEAMSDDAGADSAPTAGEGQAMQATSEGRTSTPEEEVAADLADDEAIEESDAAAPADGEALEGDEPQVGVMTVETATAAPTIVDSGLETLPAPPEAPLESAERAADDSAQEEVESQEAAVPADEDDEQQLIQLQPVFTLGLLIGAGVALLVIGAGIGVALAVSRRR